MAELLPCPFCNKKLIHTNGKRVNRYYKGEPTIYKHFPEGCILDGLQITEKTLGKWNTRVKPKTKKSIYQPYEICNSGYPLRINIEFENGEVITYKRG